MEVQLYNPRTRKEEARRWEVQEHPGFGLSWVPSEPSSALTQKTQGLWRKTNSKLSFMAGRNSDNVMPNENRSTQHTHYTRPYSSHTDAHTHTVTA